jgi:hypothetical protein
MKKILKNMMLKRIITKLNKPLIKKTNRKQIYTQPAIKQSILYNRMYLLNNQSKMIMIVTKNLQNFKIKQNKAKTQAKLSNYQFVKNQSVMITKILVTS